MITHPTVLILGAGASSHLGYPLGSELKQQICELLNPRRIRAATPRCPQINDRPEEELTDFHRRLANSGWDSIDAFLAANPDLVSLGKIAIVAVLVKQEIFKNLMWPNSVGWYDDLFKAMMTPTLAELSQNQLSVITFNYDRSLEEFLAIRIRHHYNVSPQQAMDAVCQLQIIHPNGIMGRYPDIPYNATWDQMEERVDSVKVVHELEEREDNFCNAEFGAAHEALTRARFVYFLGFGFHDDNMRRLKFFTPSQNGNIGCCSTHRKLPAAEEREFKQRMEASYALGGIFVDVSCNDFFHETRRLLNP